MRLWLFAILALSLIALASCSPKRHTDPGVSLPNVGTAIGRASLMGDLIEDEATHNHQIAHGAMKDAWGRTIDYAQRQRSEHMSAERSLDEATKDRNSLIKEVETKTHELIAEHTENEWLGWRLRRLWHWALGLGIASLVVLVIVSDFIPAGALRRGIGFVFIEVPRRVVRLFSKGEA